jgi:2-keto-4-pentenoate hydratase/2-oxohepta-3-ene-1,7-dioic acid hydratase in catechol pathway
MLASSAFVAAPEPAPGITRYARFEHKARTSYGVVEGDRVRAIRGSPFEKGQPNGPAIPLSEVKLLFPCEPPKILAVGLNYKSHLGKNPTPKQPEIFYKPITCLTNPGDPIVMPRVARNVHYEGELVIVIGRRVANVSRSEAEAAIFGVTCGNDVSERDWQNGPEKDLQWWRAKGTDTFGPLGPWIVRGLDYSNLLLQTRVNGQVKQKQSTSDLLFDCPAIVSFISNFVTLNTGDVIYTGTPGATSALKTGDVVEVEIEGIGILRNPVASA